jgi:hypothetical protein
MTQIKRIFIDNPNYKEAVNVLSFGKDLGELIGLGKKEKPRRFIFRVTIVSQGVKWL